MPASTMARAIGLAFLVIFAAAWAVARHFTHVPAPMIVPVGAPAAPTYDIEAGELPAPELVEPDAS